MQKPAKAMQRFLKRESCWVEAYSTKDLANTLASRMGSDPEVWHLEVKGAISTGKLIAASEEGGRQGYRTQNWRERKREQAKASPQASAVEIDIRVAVVV